MGPGRERRSAERFSIDRLIKLELDHQKPLSARGLNISIGGLLCSTEEPVDPLTRMRMSLSLPDGDGHERQVDLEGTVLHYRSNTDGGYTLGIHFDSIGAAERRLISRYIAQLDGRE